MANGIVGSSCLAIVLLVCGCSSSAEDDKPSGSGSGPQPILPATPSDCPVLSTGTVSVLGKDVRLWVGERRADKKGPVLFYWHGTGSVAEEIQAFMAPMITEIQDEGGVVASFTSTVGTGANTGNNVWFTGDYELADIIVACAVNQLNIDTRRIYTAGCSAGGLQAGSMVLARSSYLAGAMPNSGGNILVSEWQDTHTPSAITTHGSYDRDVVVIHFSEWSAKLDQDIANRGGFAIDCEHAGGHCGATPEVVAAQWQFLKDHPFGVSEDPYASGLPASFPSYCKAFTAQ
jgi:poly(3-hydroxybutyrate) depolymerase